VNLSQQQREQLVEFCASDLQSDAVARVLCVRRDPVRHLEQRWKLHGRLGLMETPSKRQYSFETKKPVVERSLAGETKME